MGEVMPITPFLWAMQKVFRRDFNEEWELPWQIRMARTPCLQRQCHTENIQTQEMIGLHFLTKSLGDSTKHDNLSYHFS